MAGLLFPHTPIHMLVCELTHTYTQTHTNTHTVQKKNSFLWLFYRKTTLIKESTVTPYFTGH